MVLAPHVCMMGKPVRVYRKSSGLHSHSAWAADLSLPALTPSDEFPHACWCLVPCPGAHTPMQHTCTAVVQCVMPGVLQASASMGRLGRQS